MSTGLRCDICKKKNKGHYISKIIEVEDKRFKKGVNSKMLTMCSDCYSGGSTTDTEKKMLEKISTPYWVHMGLKPTKKEQAQLNYMKRNNLSWGDLRMQRMRSGPTTNAGVEKFQQHVKQYGGRSAPDVSFEKTR